MAAECPDVTGLRYWLADCRRRQHVGRIRFVDIEIERFNTQIDFGWLEILLPRCQKSRLMIDNAFSCSARTGSFHFAIAASLVCRRWRRPFFWASLKCVTWIVGTSTQSSSRARQKATDADQYLASLVNDNGNQKAKDADAAGYLF